MGQRDDHSDLWVRYEQLRNDPHRRVTDLLELSAELGRNLASTDASPPNIPSSWRSRR